MRDVVARARDYAFQAHRGQTYGDDPYTKHLQDVHDTLVEFGVTDSQVLAAGYLHDIVEDTDIGISDIESEFGSRIADIVWFCTDEHGESRNQRKQATYKKWRALIDTHPDGYFDDHRVVKIVDRICNLRGCPERLLEMYRREQCQFAEAIGPHRLLEVVEELLT